LAVDGGRGLNWTRWVGRTVDLVAVGSDAEAATEGRLWIAAGASPRLHSQTARLRAGRPGRPLSPLTVACAVADLVSVTGARSAAVTRFGLVATALAAQAPVALCAVARLRTRRPVAPLAPAAVHYKSTTRISQVQS